MQPPYVPFWQYNILDQIVIGAIYWTIVAIVYQMFDPGGWRLTRKRERNFDFEAHQRQQVEEWHAELEHRRRESLEAPKRAFEARKAFFRNPEDWYDD